MTKTLPNNSLCGHYVGQLRCVGRDLDGALSEEDVVSVDAEGVGAGFHVLQVVCASCIGRRGLHPVDQDCCLGDAYSLCFNIG